MLKFNTGGVLIQQVSPNKDYQGKISVSSMYTGTVPQTKARLNCYVFVTVKVSYKCLLKFDADANAALSRKNY